MATRTKHHPADDVLLARYQRGDMDALALLVQRYKTALMNFIAQFIGSIEVATPLLRETLLQAVQQAPNLAHDTGFAFVAFRIARSLCLEHLETRRTTDGGELAASVGVTNVPGLQDPALAQLAQVPHNLRDVLLLREVGGLDFEEIARIVGDSDQAVKVRLRAALEHLWIEAQDISVTQQKEIS